jgi:hypothetical protein
MRYGKWEPLIQTPKMLFIWWWEWWCQNIFLPNIFMGIFLFVSFFFFFFIYNTTIILAIFIFPTARERTCLWENVKKKNSIMIIWKMMKNFPSVFFYLLKISIVDCSLIVNQCAGFPVSLLSLFTEVSE